MPQGKIKWFDNKKGYGFITVDGKEDIFVHYSQIEGTGFKTLRDGESVECDIVQGTKGLYADRRRRVAPFRARAPWPRSPPAPGRPGPPAAASRG
jgi:cold shock protein